MITIPWKADSLIPVDISQAFKDGDVAEFALTENDNTILKKEIIQNGEEHLLELSAEDTSNIPVGYYEYTIDITSNGKVTYSFNGQALIRETYTSGSVVRGEIINNSASNQITNDYIHIDTTAGWNNNSTLIGIAGHIYIYTDYTTTIKDGVTVNVPNMKIGDGNAFLIDNPFITSSVDALINLHIEDISKHVTSDEKALWNDKVRCYIDTDDNENIIFTTS